MTMRSRRETVHFRHPFRIKGIDRELAPGAYEVVTDEEMIEGLSFPCFRRVATLIMVPGAPPQRSAMEMISIDRHRGMAAQKATDIRRVLADVEANAKMLRDKQGVVEIQILSAPAASWSEAVAKARYVLNLYSAGLSPTDTHHRDLVAAVLADFARLAVDET
jgi:hypothetical protein